MKIFTIVLFTLAQILVEGAKAESVRSSDGRWIVNLETPTMHLGEHSQLSVKLAASEGSSCPKLVGVIFDMPQHGHGTNYKPRVENIDTCDWRVRNLVPTMRGVWRLRLVLEDGAKTTVADQNIDAQ